MHLARLDVDDEEAASAPRSPSRSPTGPTASGLACSARSSRGESSASSCKSSSAGARLRGPSSSGAGSTSPRRPAATGWGSSRRRGAPVRATARVPNEPARVEDSTSRRSCPWANGRRSASTSTGTTRARGTCSFASVTPPPSSVRRSPYRGGPARSRRRWRSASRAKRRQGPLGASATTTSRFKSIGS